VTPEYPNGTYAYFATIDEDGNSAYPYVIGPTYYGVVLTENFARQGPGGGNAPTQVVIDEAVQTYTPGVSSVDDKAVASGLTIHPTPATDVVVIQVAAPMPAQARVELHDTAGRLMRTSTIQQGSTMCYLDVQTLYAGMYTVTVHFGGRSVTSPIIVGE
jgi:hypothetical protein